MRPMLATAGDVVPRGTDWVHEVKWDGIRALVGIHEGRVTVTTRTERDVSVAFPELHRLAETGLDAWIDGELVALGAGVPTLLTIADRVHQTNARKAAAFAQSKPVTLLAFDVLAVGGRDVTAQPWRERRRLLESLELDPAVAQVPPTYDDGQVLLSAVADQGLEGIVSKRVGATYRTGVRSRDWLKFPLRTSDSFVVGGFRPERERNRLGALLIGIPGRDGLQFRGRVGSGLTGKTQQRVESLLQPLVSPTNPFASEVPGVDAAGATWVRPELIVEVTYLTQTPGGRLRQPAFAGVRADLTVTDLGSADREESS